MLVRKISAGSGVSSTRNGRKRQGWMGGRPSVRQLPGRAVLAVLQGDAEREQFVADAIGLGEVARLARVEPRRDAAARFPPAPAPPSGALLARQFENRSSAEAEERERAGERLAARDVLERMHLGDRLRRVEVVAQRFEHAGAGRASASGGGRVEEACSAPSRPAPAPSRSS